MRFKLYHSQLLSITAGFYLIEDLPKHFGLAPSNASSRNQGRAAQEWKCPSSREDWMGSNNNIIYLKAITFPLEQITDKGFWLGSILSHNRNS